MYDCLLQIAEVETDPFVLDKALEIRQAFPSVIINECRGSSQARAHGLIIYFPPVEDLSIPSTEPLIWTSPTTLNGMVEMVCEPEADYEP